MIKDELIKLDFTSGIKARDINQNFNTLHDSLKRERKVAGGYGIVSGFDLHADTENFRVTVESGTIINHQGEELQIPKTTFDAGAPEYVARTEKIMCPSDGIITLAAAPYSPSGRKRVKFVPPYDTILPDRKEFNIECRIENRTVPYLQLSGRTVYINNPGYWFGKELLFTYYVTDDRVDAILVHEDGTYRYEKSIVSTNPSHVDLSDYGGADDYMMVGVIHWKIGDSIKADYYTNHRTYRNLYVTDDGKLFVNGKEYKEPRVIHFIKPDDPEENDMWYDTDNRVLLIWSFENNEFGWHPVNDFSTTTMRESKMWTPETWPEDSQTFLFGKDEINLNFVPNTNALEIYMDNGVLMSDQYVEIVSRKHDGAPDYMAQGIGFRLKEPMDRPAYLQVVVNHQVKSSPIIETFQRAAIFIAENYAYQTDVNRAQIYKTDYPYVVGAKQLECYVDGKRLVPGVEFVELKNDNTMPTEDEILLGNLMSNYFMVKTPLAPGQLVNHRISKHVWSYDQVSQLLDDIRSDIKDLKGVTVKLQEDLDGINQNVVSQVKGLSGSVSTLSNKVAELEKKEIAEGSIGLNHLTSNVRSHLFSGKTCAVSMPATDIKLLSGFRKSDFINVFLISQQENRPLIKDIDYTIEDTEKGARIDLSADYITSENTLYVTGLAIGA